MATAKLRLGDAVNLVSGEHRTLDSFRQIPLHAVAGIGNPGAFFDGLRAAGLEIVAHPLADHAALDAASLPFPAGTTVLMTEKDAVKCRSFAGPGVVVRRARGRLRAVAAQELLALVLERTGLIRAGVHIG